ncbi:zinc-binding protein A33 [Denticeps clupeoides]|uniref:Uncharacterized protein n=1 Tax=Denticeps clupeoides TaxID=299321 RepID=A0AAY4ESN6_9TELE|nr:zinc-binding protein A33-like [Denticeps clupeoides]
MNQENRKPAGSTVMADGRALCDSDGSLEHELTCPICLGLFSEPVTLPCGHTYCKVCLEKTVMSLKFNNDQHCCPECRGEFPVSAVQHGNIKLRNIVENYKTSMERASAGSRECMVWHIQTGYHSSPDSDGGQQSSPDLEEPESQREEGELGASCQDDTKTSEGRSRLTSLVTDLSSKLATAEDQLAKAEVARAAHANLWDSVTKLMDEMKVLVQDYSTVGMRLIETELRPREELTLERIRCVSSLLKQLKAAQLKANDLMAERDEAKFREGLMDIEPLIDVTLAETFDENVHPNSMMCVCDELEHQNTQLQLGLRATQRALRALLNPSEVTLDPDTVHPNLILSEDLKTVSFSAVKQTYPTRTGRFTNFLQVLSSQAFSDGEHCWGLEMENCSWIVGVCYGSLPRSGLGSALESSSGSWGLMYCESLLRAYEKGRDTQLKRTTALRKVQICLSFKRSSLSFYSVSNVDASVTHLHTFRVLFTEPVYLALRIMSGHPKARITFC